MAHIEDSTLIFLKNLKKNNNREWFTEHKSEYDSALKNVKVVQKEVHAALSKIDEIEKDKLFRIYRDVRFSKDKTPYTPDFRMSFSRAGAHRRGGYYLVIDPEVSFVGVGFFNPNPADLKLIRSHISADGSALQGIIGSEPFSSTYGELIGDQVKTTPKGFSPDDPHIDLIRFKQFIAKSPLDESVVTSEKLVPTVIERYKAIRPFFDYFSDILTHDLNGESLID